MEFQRKNKLAEAEERLVSEFARQFKSTEGLELKLNDYRRIQDRNDYDCVNVCSSFLAKAIAHLEAQADINRAEIFDFISEREEFNLEQLVDHFTKYSYKR